MNRLAYFLAENYLFASLQGVVENLKLVLGAGLEPAQPKAEGF